MTPVITGLEQALRNPPRALTGRRLGLLTNPSGIDRAMRSTIDLFHSHPKLDLLALYGPEHGVRGEAQAGEHIAGGRDLRTGLPVHSLYSETRVPTPDMLQGIDALVIDLQDIGVRYATYLSTVAHVLTASDAHGVEVVVLDRPNPLGGAYIAGNVLDPAFASFVGIHTIPICHGLTIGEFARLWCRDHDLSPPVVIPMSGWSRTMTYDATGLPWVFPSPNLPTLDSVTIYPATCPIEGTTLSEGRGTTRPFEIVGAPWIDPHELADRVASLDIPGIAARPLYFTPTFSKHAGTRCGGVQFVITDRSAFDSVRFGVLLIRLLHDIDREQFGWIQSGSDRSFIDLLYGTDQVRRAIEHGADLNDIAERWRDEVQTFADRRSAVLLYD
ncbi:MAG TPA: DUF1343 domain-containing protein [Thermomicrobiales bacterium]|nr:DUF1343 domain-containing protein [Thermomicrobiales bacterium]